MSPTMLPNEYAYKGFPRVSGDEPQGLISPQALQGFSPRERG